MPSQSSCFQRFDKFSLLRNLEVAYLDRTRRQMAAHDVG